MSWTIKAGSLMDALRGDPTPGTLNQGDVVRLVRDVTVSTGQAGPDAVEEVVVPAGTVATVKVPGDDRTWIDSPSFKTLGIVSAGIVVETNALEKGELQWPKDTSSRG